MVDYSPGKARLGSDRRIERKRDGGETQVRGDWCVETGRAPVCTWLHSQLREWVEEDQ